MNISTIAPHFLKDKQDIEAWLKKMEIINWEIIKDKDYGWAVNVRGNVLLNRTAIRHFPVKFNIVEGFFTAAGCSLESLEGAPEIVEGRFNINSNKLTSLDFSPKRVAENYHCKDNYMKNLIGIKHVGESLLCSFNPKLTSLEGCPEEIYEDFDCQYTKLTNLIGGPQKVVGDYNCSRAKLVSLEGVASYIGRELNFSSNKIKNLYHFPTDYSNEIFFHGADNPFIDRMNELGIETIIGMREYDAAKQEKDKLIKLTNGIKKTKSKNSLIHKI